MLERCSIFPIFVRTTVKAKLRKLQTKSATNMTKTPIIFVILDALKN